MRVVGGILRPAQQAIQVQTVLALVESGNMKAQLMSFCVDVGEVLALSGHIPDASQPTDSASKPKIR